MMKPKIIDTETRATLARRAAAEADDPMLATLIAVRDQPRRMIRNPCGDEATCTHAYCYGSAADAEVVRATGLSPEHTSRY